MSTHMTDNPDNVQCEVFRIIYRCAAWKTKSERYYTAATASEALEDIYHSFHTGAIHAAKIKIHDIEQYDRYSNLWVSRIHEALENLNTIDVKTLIVKDDKITLRRG